jgi:hypothetical protein
MNFPKNETHSYFKVTRSGEFNSHEFLKNWDRMRFDLHHSLFLITSRSNNKIMGLDRIGRRI